MRHKITNSANDCVQMRHKITNSANDCVQMRHNVKRHGVPQGVSFRESVRLREVESSTYQ